MLLNYLGKILQLHHRPLPIHRIISFFDRTRWMATLAGGIVGAIVTLISIHKDRDAIQSVCYRGTPVRFRGYDEQALREVLIDREYAFLTDLLSETPTPTVLDVGAHIGTFAIWVLSVNAKARILSVEADPRTHRVTELNVAEFVDSGAKWQVIHGAAGRRDGEVLRFSDIGPSMSHHIDQDGSLEVCAISLTTLLDRVAPNGTSVDLVKIDIEGAEEAFLLGAPDMLKRVNALVIELHPELCNTKRVRLLLERRFDSVEDISGRQSKKPLLYCRHGTFS